MAEDRDNKGKRRMSLIPIDEFEAVIDIFEFGAKKYSDFNWQKAENIDNFLNSAYRHMFELSKGEYIDSESGKLHFSHIITNMLMAAWVYNNKMNKGE